MLYRVTFGDGSYCEFYSVRKPIGFKTPEHVLIGWTLMYLRTGEISAAPVTENA